MDHPYVCADPRVSSCSVYLVQHLYVYEYYMRTHSVVENTFCCLCCAASVCVYRVCENTFCNGEHILLSILRRAYRDLYVYVQSTE